MEKEQLLVRSTQPSLIGITYATQHIRVHSGRWWQTYPFNCNCSERAISLSVLLNQVSLRGHIIPPLFEDRGLDSRKPDSVLPGSKRLGIYPCLPI